jgi:hypothetical protein
MDLLAWTYLLVGLSFALYLGIPFGVVRDLPKNFMLPEEEFLPSPMA